MTVSQIFKKVRLVTPNEVGLRDHDYEKQFRPCALGVAVGQQVEIIVRHILNLRYTMSEKRVLLYDERQPSGIYNQCFREVDALRFMQGSILEIFEIKCCDEKRIRHGRGARQVNMAAHILCQAGLCRCVKKRVIYVAQQSQTNLPILTLDDETSEFGAIFIQPQIVEETGLSLGMRLPFGWKTLEGRKQPLQEAWKTNTLGEAFQRAFHN